MVCSAWFRERLRKVSLKKENDMVQDIDIKSKRILLFDFDGTLIETASGNTFDGRRRQWSARAVL